MISPQDQRRLEEIERHLLAGDPDLGRRLTWPPEISQWRVAGAFLLFTIGLFSLVIGLASASFRPVAISALSGLAGWVWVFTCRHATAC